MLIETIRPTNFVCGSQYQAVAGKGDLLTHPLPQVVLTRSRLRV